MKKRDKNYGKIYYVGYYSNRQDTNAFPSAVTKMDYIIEALNEIGYKVEVISPCRLTRRDGKILTPSTNKINDFAILHTGGSIPEYNAIAKFMQIIYSMVWLFFFLLKKISKYDTVIYYHVTITDSVVCLARRIKKFRLIMEVEEIFSDVDEKTKKRRNNEIKKIKEADSYLLATGLLNSEFNKDNLKKYAIVHGSYKVTRKFENVFNDNQHHVVYAGILRRDKGVDTAINVAKYLNSDYTIHILGYGEKEDIKRVKSIINDCNKTNECLVKFHGLLSGDEYSSFIQSCDIGLCTQSPDVSYNSTAFPSKILSYLSNGIEVISIRIKSIECSDVASLVHMYDNNAEAELQIAQIIKQIIKTNKKHDMIRNQIKMLDIDFKNEINVLIKS